MNKRQKDVISYRLSSEEDVINELTELYNQALQDVRAKLKDLEEEIKKDPSMTSKIYQHGFQKQLEKQLKEICDNLESKSFDTVQEYLNECYTNGFVGVMYDIHGQGVPFIMPIDQASVVRAIVTDSKLSKSLYESMGFNIKTLKTEISREISRGLATSLSYAQTSRNIQVRTGVGLHKAYRIVRTEGNRISSAASYDAQKKALKNGADIVKEWCATLDRRTRRDHASLDGQLREIDEDFEVNGHHAKYPGAFGVAKEDINCRCCTMQRARCLLDDEELERLKMRAEFFGLDKSKSFSDFKTKYLNAADILGTMKVGKDFLKIDDYPSFMRDTKMHKQQTQAFMDYVNSVEGNDGPVKRLYKNLGKAQELKSTKITLKLSYSEQNHFVQTSYSWVSGDVMELKISIPKITAESLISRSGTIAHETGHLLDAFMRVGSRGKSRMFSSLSNAISSYKGMGEGMKKVIEDAKKAYKDIFEKIDKEFKPKFDDLTEKMRNVESMKEYKAYTKQWEKLNKERSLAIDDARRSYDGGGIDALEDIFDALSSGRYRDNGTVMYGHGSKYYRQKGSAESEIWANFCNLSLTRPDLIEILKKDQPELVNALTELAEEMEKELVK